MTGVPYPSFLMLMSLFLFALHLSNKLTDGRTYLLSGKTLGQVVLLCYSPVGLQLIYLSISTHLSDSASLGSAVVGIVIGIGFGWILLHTWDRWLFVFNTTTKTIQDTLTALPGYRLRTEEEKHYSALDDFISPENTAVIKLSGMEYVVRVSKMLQGMCWLRIPGNGKEREKQHILSMVSHSIEPQLCSSSIEIAKQARQALIFFILMFFAIWFISIL